MYAERRQRLLADVPINSVILIPSARETNRNNDVDHSFRQDSDFYYLTGFEEPDALLVLRKTEVLSCILFCRPRDKEREIWDGYRMGPERAEERLGVDFGYSIDSIDQHLSGMLDGMSWVYYPMLKNPEFDQQVHQWLRQMKPLRRRGVHIPERLADIQPLLHEHRLIKSAQELDLMRQASAISSRAHERAMRAASFAEFEYQLEAEINHEFAMNGARREAYPAIVGSGRHACVLHYTDNNDRLRPENLVLIDAGAEYQYYAADITRTFPLGGKFSESQAKLYQVVLDAEEAAIAAIAPGVSFDEPNQIAVRILTTGLVNLGLLDGDVEALIKEEKYKEFYMHKTSHWLGMDVHDVGRYKDESGAWRTFEPGMVLTVEPGLYIAPDSAVDAQWQGIGIRIEDNIVVTEDGHEVMTDAVKTIEAIEALMAQE